jgi:hypothetical protein
VALADPIQERFGAVARWLFHIGFWAAATSSIVGAWNGSAYLFADSVRTARDVPDERAEEYLSEKGGYFRAMLVWIIFPRCFCSSSRSGSSLSSSTPLLVPCSCLSWP